MKKNIIWDNWNIDVEDWIDFLNDEYPECTDEYEQLSIIHEMNNEHLDDERVNLDINVGDEIIVIGSLGRWNGTARGYKIIKSGNISDCLYDNDCDWCTWYCDKYNMRFDGAHHDGRNHYVYRTWKDGISSAQKDNFLYKVYNGKATSRDISRYTKSLRPYVAKVYGW